MTWSLPGYRVGSLIGRGAFGEVWSGVHLATGEPVALKRLPTTTLGDRDRAVAEAGVLAALHHPHLVGLRAFLPQHDCVVLALELASGGSLADLLRRRDRLTPAEVSACFSPVAAALAHIHDRGITHGDVSAGNVLFSREGRAKLADLGMARLLCGGNAGGALGTPAYVDPVVAAGGVPGLATDVFSLAAVAFHALTGQAPWSAAGGDVSAVLSLAASGHVRELGRLDDACPPEMGRAVRRALEADPARRPTAAQFALDLRASIAPRAVALTAGRVGAPSTRPFIRDAAPPSGAASRGPAFAPIDQVPLDLTNIARPQTAHIACDPVPRSRRREGLQSWTVPSAVRRVPTAPLIAVSAAIVILAGSFFIVSGLGRHSVARTAPTSSPTSAADRSTGRDHLSSEVPSPTPERRVAHGDPVMLLATLDERRAEAYADRDASALRAIYGSASLADADVAQLAGRVPMGCGLQGLRTDYRNARIVGRDARSTTVEAWVTIAPAVLRCDGRPDVEVQGTTGRRMVIVLDTTDEGRTVIKSLRYA